jgi:hypothetical protein
MADRTVSVKLTADVAGYMASMRSAGMATRDLEKAARDVRKAHDEEADAAGAVRVAEAQLANVRADSKAKTSQLASAEEKLASSYRRLESAQESTRAATERFDKAQENARKNTDKFGNDVSKVAQRANAQFNALTFTAAFAGMPAAAAGAAALTVGALAVIPAAAISYAAVIAAQNTKVQASYNALARNVETTFADAARPLSGDFGKAADDLSASVDRLRPQIDSLFKAVAPDIAVATGAVTSLAENAFPGLVVAAKASETEFRAIRTVSSQLGSGVSDFFTNISAGADGAARDLKIVGGAVQDLAGFLGSLGANVANNGGGSLGQFRVSLSQIESALLSLTASGSSIYGFFNGFGASVNGMLTIVRGAASVLALLPSQITGFGGALLATSRVAAAFGLDIGKAFDGLGGKVSNATGLGNKLKTGFMGLAEGALNPTTLAVAGLSLGLQILGQHQADAAAKAAAQADRERDLADALRESGGAIDENVRKQAAMALQQFDNGDGTRNLLSDVQKLAGNSGMQQLTQAYLGNATAGSSLKQTLLDNIRATVQQAGANDTVMSSLNTQISLWQQGKGSLDSLVGSLGDFTDGTFGLDGAQQKNIQSNVDLLNVMNQTGGTFAKSAQDARNLAAASASSAGGIQSLTREQELAQQSSTKLEAAFSAMADATGDAESQVTALTTILDTLTGRVPTHEEAMQSINDTLRQMGDQFGSGADHAKGWGAALLNADGTVNTFTENGSTLQNTLVTLQTGFAQAGQSINGLVAQGIPLAQAQKQVNDELSTSRDRFIDAATAAGLTAQQAQNLADKYGLVPALVETAVLQPGMLDAIHNAGVAQSAVKAIPNQWTVVVDGLTQQAEVNLNNLGYHVTHMPNGQVAITANTAPAQSAIDGLVIRNQGRTINMTVTTTDASGGRHVSTSMMNAEGSVLAPMAKGGVLGFANGGQALTSMSSVASVVPPDTWRVVGDRMRNKEYYIPADGSQRSQQILAAANADPQLAGVQNTLRSGQAVVGSMSAGVVSSSVTNEYRPDVQVFVDGQEFRGMIQTEIKQDKRQTRRGLTSGSGNAR